MRLHTLIFATKQRIPIIGFVYDPKISNYMKLLNAPDGGNVEDIDVEKNVAAYGNILENYKDVVENLDDVAKQLEEKAELNEKYLGTLLK